MRARNVMGALATVPLIAIAPVAGAAEIASANQAVIGPLNDASVTEDKTTASYKDATDQLCVKVGSWGSGANNSGTALILRPDGTVFKSILRNKNESGCTANLSIPEDATYYLQAEDCVNSGNCTLSAKVRFYS